ncbi:MAG: hypothetical protein AAF517_11695, partial [Planctomycetota bacterium]
LADTGTRAIVLAADSASRGRAEELTGAWEELGLRSLVLGVPGNYAGTQTESLVANGEEPVRRCFHLVFALQLLAYHAARAAGRDPNLWLGGERTDLINRVSKTTIRGSDVWSPKGSSTTE